MQSKSTYRLMVLHSLSGDLKAALFPTLTVLGRSHGRGTLSLQESFTNIGLIACPMHWWWLLGVCFLGNLFDAESANLVLTFFKMKAILLESGDQCWTVTEFGGFELWDLGRKNQIRRIGSEFWNQFQFNSNQDMDWLDSWFHSIKGWTTTKTFGKEIEPWANQQVNSSSSPI